MNRNGVVKNGVPVPREEFVYCHPLFFIIAPLGQYYFTYRGVRGVVSFSPGLFFKVNSNFIKFQSSQNLEAGSRRGTDAPHHSFLDCFMIFLLPTPFPEMCSLSSGHGIADSGGSALKVLPYQLVFMAAFFFLLCSVSRVTGRYAKCETKVFETHVMICCSTTHGSCSC